MDVEPASGWPNHPVFTAIETLLADEMAVRKSPGAREATLVAFADALLAARAIVDRAGVELAERKASRRATLPEDLSEILVARRTMDTRQQVLNGAILELAAAREALEHARRPGRALALVLEQEVDLVHEEAIDADRDVELQFARLEMVRGTEIEGRVRGMIAAAAARSADLRRELVLLTGEIVRQNGLPSDEIGMAVAQARIDHLTADVYRLEEDMLMAREDVVVAGQSFLERARPESEALQAAERNLLALRSQYQRHVAALDDLRARSGWSSRLRSWIVSGFS